MTAVAGAQGPAAPLWGNFRIRGGDYRFPRTTEGVEDTPGVKGFQAWGLVSTLYIKGDPQSSLCKGPPQSSLCIRLVLSAQPPRHPVPTPREPTEPCSASGPPQSSLCIWFESYLRLNPPCPWAGPISRVGKREGNEIAILESRLRLEPKWTLYIRYVMCMYVA